MDAPSLRASAEWLGAHPPTARRGDPAWMSIDLDDGWLATYGAVLHHADAYETYNVWTILGGGKRAVLPTPVSNEVPFGSPSSMWFPNLVVTLPGYDSRLIGSRPVSQSERELLVEAIVGWAHDAGLRLVSFLFVWEDERALARALVEAGFRSFPLEWNGSLDLGGKTLDEHVEGQSKRRRHRLRKELAELRDEGVVTTEHDIADHIDEIVDARCALLASYGHPSDPVGQGQAIGLLRRHLGDGAFRAFRACRGDATYWSVFVVHGRTWYAHWAGGVGGRDRLYFAAMYYAAIEAAARAGVDILDYGHGATRAKANRGCRVTLSKGYVLPLDTGLAPLIEATTARLTSDPVYTRR